MSRPEGTLALGRALLTGSGRKRSGFSWSRTQGPELSADLHFFSPWGSLHSPWHLTAGRQAGRWRALPSGHQAAKAVVVGSMRAFTHVCSHAVWLGLTERPLSWGQTVFPMGLEKGCWGARGRDDCALLLLPRSTQSSDQGCSHWGQGGVLPEPEKIARFLKPVSAFPEPHPTWQSKGLSENSSVAQGSG